MTISKKFLSRLVQLQVALITALCLFACDSPTETPVSKSNEKSAQTGSKPVPGTASPAPVTRLANPPGPTPADDSDIEPAIVNLPNSITGDWRIVGFWSHFTPHAPSQELIRRLLDKSDTQLLFKVQEKEASLELTSGTDKKHPDCSVKVRFHIAYCCRTMHRIFLAKINEPATETPSGCVASSIDSNLDAEKLAQHVEKALQLEASLNGTNQAMESTDTFRFIHDLDQTVLMGPYPARSSNTPQFQTVIRMIRNN